MQNRIYWLDTAKAIGIVLVVIGHSIPEGFGKLWIYSFHMPLFFLISGIFLYQNYEKNENYDLFYIKKTTSILIPYIFFGIINTVLLIPVWGLVETLQGLKFSGISGGPTWFLLSLFISEIVCYLLIKKFKYSILFFLSILISLVIGYIFAYNNIDIALFLSNIFISIFFVGLGFLAGKYVFKLNNINQSNRTKLFIFSIFLILTVANYYIATKTHTRLDMIYNKLGEPYTMIPGAFTGIILVLCLSILMSYIRIDTLHKFISYIGKNTLIIFALHMIVNLNFTVYLKPFFHSTPIYASSKFIIVWLSMFLCIYLINNFMPFMIGKSNKK